MDDLARVTLADLRRWEDGGAVWRLRSLGVDRAVVELRECTGMLVELALTEDPAALDELRRRPRSDD